VVLYLSTDLEELVAGCDRVLVFYRGGICAELSGAALTAPNLSRIMNTGEAQDMGLGRPDPSPVEPALA
jgi:ribose transport system ATP-binding protein/rhamnose transport system ATP-binding protein